MTRIIEDQALRERVAQLEHEIEAWQFAFGQSLHTVCAFGCGWRATFDTPEEGCALAREHIITCPGHPMRTAEAERDALKERVAKLEQTLKLMRLCASECVQVQMENGKPEHECSTNASNIVTWANAALSEGGSK